MRIGTSLQTSFTHDEVSTAPARILEWARAAREAELDSLVVGDHHSLGFP
jgi:hypothetical protein